jgi:hypothetical protein
MDDSSLYAETDLPSYYEFGASGSFDDEYSPSDEETSVNEIGYVGGGHSNKAVDRLILGMFGKDIKPLMENEDKIFVIGEGEHPLIISHKEGKVIESDIIKSAKQKSKHDFLLSEVYTKTGKPSARTGKSSTKHESQVKETYDLGDMVISIKPSKTDKYKQKKPKTRKKKDGAMQQGE